jgi:hypothetical protein
VADGRLATFRPALLVAFLVLVVARLVVVVARRLVAVVREPALLAICRACFVRSSIRLSTLLTSARVLARLTCVCSCLIAARALLSASFIRRST